MNQKHSHRFQVVPFMDCHEIRAIMECIELFDYPIRVLEWGSGASTVFFSGLTQQKSNWLALEHSLDWYKEVAKMLEKFSSPGVMVKHIQNDLDYLEGKDDGTYKQFENYINYPSQSDLQPFNIVIVDGRARVECMKIGWKVLEEQGVMILHDAQRQEYIPGIPEQAFTIRIINPDVYSEGYLSTLFMCKSRYYAEELLKKLQCQLPATILIETSLSEPQQYNSSIDSNKTPVCVFLNTYYFGFLQSHYQKNPGLEKNTYQQQLQSLRMEKFGDSDFYSKGIQSSGWKAEDLIINCEPLQLAWAKEKGCHQEDLLDILVEQIKQLRPDVVYFQDLNYATPEIFRALKVYTRLIIGQIASPIPANANLPAFDIIISSFPHFVERFRNQGITAYYQPLAFSEELKGEKDWQSRNHDVSFVGGISIAHTEGTKLLEQLALNTPIEFWGYGLESLSDDSPIRAKHHGEVWGREMFEVLQGSKITINRHIDVAENYANNMRLFEATGSGALLITDYKDNLDELFEIGKEIVVYRSSEECIALIHYFLLHPEHAAQIAKQGQQRTLREHCYQARLAKTAEILERHLRYKWYERPLAVDLEAVSCNYTDTSISDISESQEIAWKSNMIPIRQRALIQKELKGLYENNIPFHYHVLAESLKSIASNHCKIAEIGCASGYYYEILEYLLGLEIDYLGVDFSKPLLEMAKNYYPKAKFCNADGANTPFASRQFDIVISSCVLLHVKHYLSHLIETTRIADKYIVLHRTPISRQKETRFFNKTAYGIDTFEIRFNENEIVLAVINLGFELIGCYEISVNEMSDEYDVTYVFKRTLIKMDG